MLMNSGYRIPIQGLKTRHLKGFTWKGQMFYVPQEGTQGRHTVQQILRGAHHRKELTETTSPLKVTTENTWMYLSCPFPNYWGNCKLTTLDRKTGLTCKELHTGPCMWAARAQKLAWSTQHNLLMTAGQAQIQIITASTTKPALSKHAGLIQTQEHLPCSIHVGKAHPILFQVRCGRNNKKITVIPTWLWSSCPGEKN